MLVKSLVFYLFSSSALFIYGIGLKKVLIASKQPQNYFLCLARTLVTVVITSVVLRVITVLFLVPCELTELYPFFCILFTLIFGTLTKLFVDKVFHIDTAEFVISFFSCLLAVNEAYSLVETVVIGVSCVFSYYLLLPLIFVIRWRTDYSQRHIDFKDGTLIFISISFVLFILFAINISWLNFEVL